MTGILKAVLRAYKCFTPNSGIIKNKTKLNILHFVLIFVYTTDAFLIIFYFILFFNIIVYYLFIFII